MRLFCWLKMLELLLPIDFINLIETLRFLFLHAEHSTLDYFFFNFWLARSTSKMILTMEMFYPALASEPLVNWLNDFSDVFTQVHIVCGRHQHMRVWMWTWEGSTGSTTVRRFFSFAFHSNIWSRRVAVYVSRKNFSTFNFICQWTIILCNWALTSAVFACRSERHRTIAW